MSVADLVSEAVDDDALRGVLGARGIRYTAMGPRSAGTALNFLWDSASGGGAAGRTVFARGGPDALVEALGALLGRAARHDVDLVAQSRQAVGYQISLRTEPAFRCFGRILLGDEADAHRFNLRLPPSTQGRQGSCSWAPAGPAPIAGAHCRCPACSNGARS